MSLSPAIRPDAVRAWFAGDGAATWVPVVAGLLVLYVPTYLDLASTFWAADASSHGPLILVVWAWLMWRARAALTMESRTRGASIAGWVLIATGAVMYALGRSQQMLQLEAGSQLLILPGALCVLLGWPAVRRLAFPLLFLVFLVPLPGSLIDALLVPLKSAVSAAVTQMLFSFGLPVARDGVVIYAGPYQLFIADACSGLNSLVALTAVGTLYVYLAAHAGYARNLILLSAIVPVAILANLVRVCALVLATYYGGDALGRQLHEYAGWAEIVLAFGAFFLIDRLIRVGGGRRA
ncbi:MAG TPA: exosortase [Steroidobacteraceae bacterium]